MTIIRAEDFDNFLRHKSVNMNGVLFHGSDPASIASMARQTARVIMGGDEGVANVLRFDMSALKDEPSKLLDEFYALSLLGDRRVLLVDGVDEQALRFLNPVLVSQNLANFIILVTDNLAKTSKLRLACETANLFGSIVVYAEDEAAQALRIRKLLATERLTWVGDAEQLFYATVGTDRAAVDQEAVKLCLYCLGATEITEQDVLAICGETATFGADELIDAVLVGDLEFADRMVSSLELESAGARGILPVFLLHLTRLQGLQMDAERGIAIDMALRNARPSIFFKRHNAFRAQLRKFDLSALMVMQQTVVTAILQGRKHAELWEAITSRTLLSLARSARS